MGSNRTTVKMARMTQGDIQLSHLSKPRREVLRATGRRNPLIVAGSYAVSIMEFREGLVANETQYFADRFDPAPSRAHLVERVGEIT
jgi:hypothetical protein